MIYLLSLYGLITLFEVYLIFCFAARFKSSDESKGIQGLSILVCARNEEDNLERCLNSLLQSDDAIKDVEILIGDDNSTDDTWEVIQVYEHNHPEIKGVKIVHEKDDLIAKGNVLAQLVDLASYEHILIIDADMKVSPKWRSTMSSLLEGYDMISGLTMIDKDFHHPTLQFFDWATVLHSMKAMADVRQPISILGNNMGFRKSAYEQVGGFRGLGPTDVEDLGLLKRFQKFGLRTFQYVGIEGKAYTKAQKGWTAMLDQRCRWMNGVFTHHWVLSIPAFLSRLWLLVFIVSSLINFNLSLYILGYGILLPQIKYLQFTRKTKNFFKFQLSAPIIISLLDTFALIRIILFGKVSWKGRKF